MFISKRERGAGGDIEVREGLMVGEGGREWEFRRKGVVLNGRKNIFFFF